MSTNNLIHRTTTVPPDPNSRMNSEVAIKRRLDTLRRALFIQPNSNSVILTKPHCKITVGVDQGLLIEEQIPPNYRFVTNPYFPMVFEFSGNPENQFCVFPITGRFVTTCEITHLEMQKLGVTVGKEGAYNKYCEAKLLTSTRKRSSLDLGEKSDKQSG